MAPTNLVDDIPGAVGQPHMHFDDARHFSKMTKRIVALTTIATPMASGARPLTNRFAARLYQQCLNALHQAVWIFHHAFTELGLIEQHFAP